MKVAELSRLSGVPLATIKFYLREGLLPRGEATSVNQARYDETHLDRLRLIRALIGVGGLSVATVREIAAAIDDATISTHQMLGVAARALETPVDTGHTAEELAPYVDRVRDVVGRRGWRVSEDDPRVTSIAGTLRTLDDLDQHHLSALLEPYAAATELIARADIEAIAALPERGSMVASTVVGVTLGDVILSHLRRIAEEGVSSERLAGRTNPDRPATGPHAKEAS